MASTMEYKCPCCGGIVEFDSKLQSMKCPYCDTVFTVEQMQGKDDVLSGDPAAQRPGKNADGMDVYTCQSCGGELIAEETTAATHCPYCGNPVMLTGRLSGEWKPDCVIPFQTTKEDAKAALRGFMKGKKLLPKKFLTESRLDEIKGVYVPFWLFDAQADGRFSFEATKRRSWREGDYEVTETSYYDVARSGTLDFENVPVDGSGKMAADLMESIEPFSFDALQPFQTAYLSGYLADKYDVGSEECFRRATERMERSTEQKLTETVMGYSSVSVTDRNVKVDGTGRKYALMPVWLLTSSWNGKSYTFAMNGQTGKFVGRLPMDRGSYWLYRLLWWGGMSGVLWLILHFLFRL